MFEIKKEQELSELNRLVINLKLEKKKYNKEVNDQIKENEAVIAKLVKEKE
jgi:hypothetical protein